MGNNRIKAEVREGEPFKYRRDYMIILVGIGCFIAGAGVGVVMMSLCVASHNSSLELENRQKEDKE